MSTLDSSRRQLFESRILLVLGFLAAVLLVIIGRLIELQVMKGDEYRKQAQQQQFGDVVLPARRGEILSRNSKTGDTNILATNTTLNLLYIDPLIVPVARFNLARHGLDATMRVSGSDPALPFDDACFDLVLANSVLEYVDPARLDATIAELHRVLRPGGWLFICGTANRLALRERHSGRWLVNYLPRIFDRLHGRRLQRGLAPWRLARAVRGRFIQIGGPGWLAARRAIHGNASLSLRLCALLGPLSGRMPGWIAPYIELLLQKRDCREKSGSIRSGTATTDIE